MICYVYILANYNEETCKVHKYSGWTNNIVDLDPGFETIDGCKGKCAGAFGCDFFVYLESSPRYYKSNPKKCGMMLNSCEISFRSEPILQVLWLEIREQLVTISSRVFD